MFKKKSILENICFKPHTKTMCSAVKRSAAYLGTIIRTPWEVE